MRSEIIKVLEKSTNSNFSDVGRSNIFLNMPAKAREIQAKINYWDYVKIKDFCTMKKAIHKTKRQPTERKKIFANNISNKGLISKINLNFCNQKTKINKQSN